MKHPPPWLFVLTAMPYGVAASFAGSVMPYVTADAGIHVDAIGWYGTLLLVPPVVLFLYAPIVDLGPRRKHWLVLVSAISAVFLVVSCLMPLPDHTTAFLACAAIAQLVAGLVGSCNGGLMAASLPDALRGKASGWYNVGNLSGGGLSATIVILMVGHRAAPAAIGIVLAAMMVLPALAALWIDEPAPPKVAFAMVFRTMLRDIRRVLVSKSGITGIALCMSPVGTAALVNYFSGMSKPYGASANTVALVTGLGNVGLTALGALVGGYLCDRFNRRVIYLASGTLTAVCGVVMALSPRTELTYAAGVMTYALITGFCYAAFTSTVLETIGKGSEGASTKYSLFTAAGNLAILYVGLVDTRFDEHHGVEGVITSDAALNIAGVIVLALVFWRLGSFGKWRHPEEPEPVAAAPTAPEPALTAGDPPTSDPR
ncbi:MAG TPA: MFS transporter [Kofleriaceae bacterium]|nr:MFS transporter [Kofleriaceae bacterium]